MYCSNESILIVTVSRPSSGRRICRRQQDPVNAFGLISRRRRYCGIYVFDVYLLSRVCFEHWYLSSWQHEQRFECSNLFRSIVDIAYEFWMSCNIILYNYGVITKCLLPECRQLCQNHAKVAYACFYEWCNIRCRFNKRLFVYRD